MASPAVSTASPASCSKNADVAVGNIRAAGAADHWAPWRCHFSMFKRGRLAGLVELVSNVSAAADVLPTSTWWSCNLSLNKRESSSSSCSNRVSSLPPSHAGRLLSTLKTRSFRSGLSSLLNPVTLKSIFSSLWTIPALSRVLRISSTSCGSLKTMRTVEPPRRSWFSRREPKWKMENSPATINAADIMPVRLTLFRKFILLFDSRRVMFSLVK